MTEMFCVLLPTALTVTGDRFRFCIGATVRNCFTTRMLPMVVDEVGVVIAPPADEPIVVVTGTVIVVNVVFGLNAFDVRIFVGVVTMANVVVAGPGDGVFAAATPKVAACELDVVMMRSAMSFGLSEPSALLFATASTFSNVVGMTFMVLVVLLVLADASCTSTVLNRPAILADV